MKRSAGLLLYRFKDKHPQYFLVHPGGPFWQKKDIGSWSIPKGEVEEGEDYLSAAIREVSEETGINIDFERRDFIELKEVNQNPGKKVIAWAVKADLDEAAIKSNHFEMEWPAKSGKKQTFPEVDKARWFGFEEARRKILPGQIPILEELNKRLEKK